MSNFTQLSVRARVWTQIGLRLKIRLILLHCHLPDFYLYKPRGEVESCLQVRWYVACTKHLLNISWIKQKKISIWLLDFFFSFILAKLKRKWAFTTFTITKRRKKRKGKKKVALFHMQKMVPEIKMPVKKLWRKSVLQRSNHHS